MAIPRAPGNEAERENGARMLSVIIPCYNEAFRLDPLRGVIEDHAELGWEWIFVDDGSTDETHDVLQDFAHDSRAAIQVLVHQTNLGKGAAVKTGMMAATRELAGFIDADLAASPLQFADYLQDRDIREGRTLLVGIRLLTEEKLVRRHPVRHMLGRVYQTYVSNLTGLTVYDTQCGFKLLAAARGRDLFAGMRCAGFAFDTELILLAKARGMAVREVPIAWQEQYHSRIRPWHAARMLVDILSMRRRLYRRDAPREPKGRR